MKLLLDKSKCKFTESVNGFILEVETIDPVEFIGGNGRNYILYDENEEGIGPAPDEPFVVPEPKI